MKQETPALLTVFGITGDLSHRKLLPSLYRLREAELLHDDTKIIGVTRSGAEVPELLAAITQSIEQTNESVNTDVLKWLEAALSVVVVDYNTDEDYHKLAEHLSALDDSATRLFYLSIPSTAYETVSEKLATNRCAFDSSRLLIEKPFGHDLSSAKELVTSLEKHFTEHQIYRIDHYLAKETVQNILTFRFKNPLIAGLWSNEHIQRLTITAAESIGIEGRGSFYEGVGAYRDLIQSHLLQLLALTTMERPESDNAEAIHNGKVTLLRSVQPPSDDEIQQKTARGQYDMYRSEVENDVSMTETYASVEFNIDSDTWRGVPITLQTGKALKKKRTDITALFTDSHGNKNTLTLRLQPDEGFDIDLTIKTPGFTNDSEPVTMDFTYEEDLGSAQRAPDAYERVLLDAFHGDKTLFATAEEVIRNWEISQPILDAWQRGAVQLTEYETGREIDDL